MKETDESTFAYSGDREQRFRRKANSNPDDDEQLSG
jgi:hypothetical protein